MIATELALAVTYPFAGNIGGGGFMVYRTNDGKTGALDYREKAPLAASKNMYLDENGAIVEGKSTIGAMAIGIPGTVDGLFKVHEKFGTLPFSELIQPAIDLAKKGVIVTRKQDKKLQKIDVSLEDIFLSPEDLSTKIAKAQRDLINFSDQKQHLKQQFEGLYRIAKQTDASFLGAVKAQEKKQRNGLDALEKRLLLAQRRKLADEVRRISDLQNDLFPNKSLQERQLNFSELYLEYGEELIPALMQSFNPLQFEFMILELNQQN